MDMEGSIKERSKSICQTRQSDDDREVNYILGNPVDPSEETDGCRDYTSDENGSCESTEKGIFDPSYGFDVNLSFIKPTI